MLAADDWPLTWIDNNSLTIQSRNWVRRAALETLCTQFGQWNSDQEITGVYWWI